MTLIAIALLVIAGIAYLFISLLIYDRFTDGYDADEHPLLTALYGFISLLWPTFVIAIPMTALFQALFSIGRKK